MLLSLPAVHHPRFTNPPAAGGLNLLPPPTQGQDFWVIGLRWRLQPGNLLVQQMPERFPCAWKRRSGSLKGHGASPQCPASLSKLSDLEYESRS